MRCRLLSWLGINEAQVATDIMNRPSIVTGGRSLPLQIYCHQSRRTSCRRGWHRRMQLHLTTTQTQHRILIRTAWGMYHGLQGCSGLPDNQDELVGVVVYMLRIALEASVGFRLAEQSISLSSHLVGCGPTSDEIFTQDQPLQIFVSAYIHSIHSQAPVHVSGTKMGGA